LSSRHTRRFKSPRDSSGSHVGSQAKSSSRDAADTGDAIRSSRWVAEVASVGTGSRWATLAARIA
jgi:hypothetical protein